ncbi:CDP-alcohol phosphatidyltransferase family protein [Paenibacillus sp. CN-4]|uniref:CDP-alcohol phosphatidyltransferase family protein n=1 Tax=Paenibacillus nanchangensis TaxID=3348343 RepID=UPI00397AAD5C
MKKRLPNILSCSRMVLSAGLAVTANNELLFLVIYMLCGLTDAADGYLARKWNGMTSLGAKLDSIADAIFTGMILYLIYMHMHGILSRLFILGVLLVLGIRVLNLLITKTKFGEWNVIHTLGNKMTGLALFAALPIFYTIGVTPTGGVVLKMIAVLALLASIEETSILLLSKRYDVNRKSLISGVKWRG